MILQKLRKAREEGIRYHEKKNAHRLRKALAPDTWVLAQNVYLGQQWGKKLEDRWLGPFIVVRQLPKGSYILREIGKDGVELLRPFAARRIRRFFPRGEPEVQDDFLPESVPGDEANAGEDEEEEEDVLRKRIKELGKQVPGDGRPHAPQMGQAEDSRRTSTSGSENAARSSSSNGSDEHLEETQEPRVSHAV